MTELDELFAADHLLPEPAVPPAFEEQSELADPPRNWQRSRVRSTLALAWLVGWLVVGGFLFLRGTSPADRPGATPVVAASAPVEQEPAYRTKNIEDLQPGELVLAADPETGRVEPKRVLEVYRRTSDHLRLVTFADRSGGEQQLQTTDEHPFWVSDREEFVEAGGLSVGEKVVGPHGEAQWLISTGREPHPEGIEVFNFKVEDFHTYFVAAHGRRGPPALVHNTDCYPRNDLGQFMSPNGVSPPGREFQNAVTDYARDTLDDVATEVRVTPRLDNGELWDRDLRLDVIGVDRNTGAPVIWDAKLGDPRPRENQVPGWPLLELNGGVVTGNNGLPAFPRDRVLPPTPVEVITPPDLPPDLWNPRL